VKEAIISNLKELLAIKEQLINLSPAEMGELSELAFAAYKQRRKEIDDLKKQIEWVRHQ